MFKQRQFRFSIEITATAVVAALICYYLSQWQWSRYEQKLTYFEQVEHQEARGQHVLDVETKDWASEYLARVVVRGTFDDQHTMVLINRSLDNNPGVKVVTPLMIDDGLGGQKVLLVDRGFAPYGIYREGHLPEYRAEGIQELEGIIRPSQIRKFRYSPPERPGEEGKFKEEWLRLEIDKMATQLPYAANLLPVFLEQTSASEKPWPKYHPREVLPASRHLNYSIQWASFGTFGLGFALFLQFRPKKKKTEPEAGPKPENQPG